MILSPHFTLEEMVFSQMAIRKGIDNVPGPEIIEELKLLCREILEPVRALYERPLIISSGYRCRELNAAVGGSTTSDHPRGRAADFGILNMENYEVVRMIATSSIPFDQLILEYPPDGWVHISRRARPRREILLCQRGEDGKAEYLSLPL